MGCLILFLLVALAALVGTIAAYPVVTLAIVGVVLTGMGVYRFREQAALPERVPRDRAARRAANTEALAELRYYLAVAEDHAATDPDATTLARLQFNQLDFHLTGWRTYRELERRLERLETR